MEITTTKNSLENKIKGVIVGASGSGKTTLAKTMDKHEGILLLSFEAGTGSIADADIPMIDCNQDKGVILKPTQRLEKLEATFKYLLTDEAKKTYHTVFIDSLSEIADNIIDHLLSTDEYKDPAKALKMWGEYTKEMKALIKSFRDLPHYNVIFTALRDNDKDEMGNFVKGIQMSGKISQKLPQYFDEVFFLGVESDSEGNEQRKLLTTATKSIPFAKDRSGKLDKFEPADLGAIFKKINKQKTK